MIFDEQLQNIKEYLASRKGVKVETPKVDFNSATSPKQIESFEIVGKLGQSIRPSTYLISFDVVGGDIVLLDAALTKNGVKIEADKIYADYYLSPSTEHQAEIERLKNEFVEDLKKIETLVNEHNNIIN